MIVACSTLCFARETLEKALGQIAELEFDKFELALVEDGHIFGPRRLATIPRRLLRLSPRARAGSLVSVYRFWIVDWSDP